jgi:hypothetical protein
MDYASTIGCEVAAATIQGSGYNDGDVIPAVGESYPSPRSSHPIAEWGRGWGELVVMFPMALER